jgi:hypothetical protein
MEVAHMSMQDEYNDLMNNLYVLCKDYDWDDMSWPAERKKCSGWLHTDFDTIHECPRHYTKDCDKNHPDYQEYEEQSVPCVQQETKKDDDCPF